VNALSQFELLAILLIVTAIFSWINSRPALLPHTIGLMVRKIGVSRLVIGAEAVIPELADLENLDRLAG
jgi:CPA1 family monovalent cation:H+ antiporter